MSGTITSESASIESVLKEQRLFNPPAGFGESVGGAYISSMEQYRQMHQRSIDDPEAFWGEIASELDWFTPWSRVLEWNAPDAKWFVGAATNISHNCIDRQINAGHGDETAIIWEGEPIPGKGGAGSQLQYEAGAAGPEIRELTYNDLHRDVCRFANALKSIGVKRGDVVTIYMGMVPELAIAMLACARIGAAHSVIFGGFSAQAIVDRVVDADSRVIITCDGAWRRGNVVPLKDNVDAACEELANSGHAVGHVVVVRRCHNDIDWNEGRDRDWAALVNDESDDP